jgi:hypothetical protein
VYQAYHFAKESNRHTDQKGVEHAEVPRQFISGFRSSLRQGTVKSWARAIVGHFRTDSTGGGNYRVLAGGAA